MTDRLDLDEIAAETDDEEPTAEQGYDWLSAEALADADSEAPTRPDDDQPGGSSADAAASQEPATTDGTTSESDTETSASRVTPRVPAERPGAPVGIPKTQGGAGSGDRPADTGGDGGASADAGGAADTTDGEPGAGASGRDSASKRGVASHGGEPGADADMTTAFTYRALRALESPAAAVADTTTWSDFVGVVGDVEAHVLGKFQRDNVIDLDFFNGSGTGPAERLARVGPHSMFYAERMVLVGLPEDEWIADEADWEFVPLADAADGADWAVK